MGETKKVSGILALLAAILLCSYLIYNLTTYGFPGEFIDIVNFTINLLFLTLILLGAILVITDRIAGGILLLILGISMVIFSLLHTIAPITFAIVEPYTILDIILGFKLPYISLETIFVLIDGIVVIARSLNN